MQSHRIERRCRSVLHLLLENDKFSGIVTGRGAEAIPDLENYLAFSNIRQGHIEETQMYMESLERKHENRLILTRGADRCLGWLPEFQVVRRCLRG